MKLRFSTLLSLSIRSILSTVFILFTVSIVLVVLFSYQPSSIEAISPKFVLQHLIDRPEQMFNSSADAGRILKYNKGHTKKYVVKLLGSLKGDKLKIKKSDNFALIIQVVAPKIIDFVFRERIYRGGNDNVYTYYKLIAIHEHAS